MKEIKTRNHKKDVKAMDKSNNKRFKRKFIYEKVGQKEPFLEQEKPESAENYAQDKIEKVKETANAASHPTFEHSKAIIKKSRVNRKMKKFNPSNFSDNSSKNEAKSEQKTKKDKFYASKTIKTAKAGRKKTIKTANRSVKAFEKTPQAAIKFSKNAANSAKKAAEAKISGKTAKTFHKIAKAIERAMTATIKTVTSAAGVWGGIFLAAVVIIGISAAGFQLLFSGSSESCENGDGMANDVYIGTDIFTWPLPGIFRITSPFGPREDPLTGGMEFHDGVDIAAPKNTPILAAADGKIEIANSTDSWGQGYGHFVKIRHNEIFETLYAHCVQIVVQEGHPVKKGQIIAFVWSTGRSTGNHLHFEIHQNGKQVDPLKYFETRF